MFKCKFASTAIVCLITLISSGDTKADEVFKGSEFLTWTEENRSFYIRSSIGMASLIAARNEKSHAKCIDDWYFVDMKKGDEAVLSAMRQNPGYHPRAIILAVLQKSCGSFSYSER